MKVLLFFLLFSASVTLSWTTIPPTLSSSPLTAVALSQYLLEMKTNFDWAPTTLFVKSEEAAQKKLLQKRFGSTEVLVKTEAELLDYSLQHAGKTLLFLTLEVEQESSQKMAVYVMNEALKTILKDGVPTPKDIEAPLGRACVLYYNTQLDYQGIDCLLLPNDPERN
ncbi:MAG: hypothetical protein ACRBFS_25495 [Aureispira sp.]